MRMTNKHRAAWPAAIAILVALALSGCSTTAENSGLSLVDASGNHPAGFVSTHPSIVRAPADAAQCQPCHGDGLTGGIANVSCFSASRGATGCHHDAVPNWSSPDVHGAEAKKPRVSSGFASCQVCHGVDFDVVINGFSCPDCHGPQAPHPSGPWRDGIPNNTDHTAGMSQANAPVCGRCHFNESGAGSHAPVDPPPGSNPGCFNNTLCHGAVAPHPTDGTFLPPSSHGATAKQDLSFCQECHGTPGTILFEGGVSVVKCSDCHLGAKAHPTDWQGSGTYSHRTSGNRSTACTICHDGEVLGRPAPNPDAPSCFSAGFTNDDGQTRSCHVGGPGLIHNVPFDNATHYQASGASGCTDCHAVASGSSPNPAAPLCTVCHVAGSPLTLANCSSCHGSATPPDASRKGMPVGTQYPNIDGAHVEHLDLNAAGTPISCDTCHNGIGSRTPSHYARANGRVRTLTGAGLANLGAGFPYPSQNGAPFFDNALANLTCSNVRCHGGTPLAPAPNWQTATFDPLANAGCRLCHKGANQAPLQYNDLTNSPYTQHINHAFNRNFSCTTCHDTAALTQTRHFGELANTTFPAGAASLTIVSTLNWDPVPPITKSSCTTPAQGCH